MVALSALACCVVQAVNVSDQLPVLFGTQVCRNERQSLPSKHMADQHRDYRPRALRTFSAFPLQRDHSTVGANMQGGGGAIDVGGAREDTRGCSKRIHLNSAGASMMPSPVVDACQ